MKKLLTMLIYVLMASILVGSCGTDTEGCLDDFFEEYYSECIQLCETCAEWSKMCGKTNYDVGVCIEGHWYQGDGNQSCSMSNTEIENLIIKETCSGEELKKQLCFL